MELYKYKARVLRVYDGDTFHAEISLGYDTYIKHNVRVYGIDTPELKGKSKAEGIKARDRLIELIAEKEVYISSVEARDKYGRCLAEVFLGDINIAQTLINEGMGKAYFGGKKES